MFNFLVIDQFKMSFIEGETTSFRLRYVVKGGPKDRPGQKGDFLLRAKGHFKGGPKTVDETMEE